MIGIRGSSIGFSIRSNLATAQSDLNRSLERLSTGKRINRASDDPSGLVGAEGLKEDLTVARRTIEGLERQNLFLGAREGALSVVQDLTKQLSGIVVQAANKDALSGEELEALQGQANSILQSLDTIAGTTRFQDQTIIDAYSSTGLGLAGKIDLLGGDLEAIQELAEGADKRVAKDRATIGTQMQSNSSRIRALFSEETGLADALSLIEDTDYAKEVAAQVRAQVLRDANISLFAVEQEQARTALKLLESAISL